MASAIARIDDGLPVNPCNANTPVVDVPTWESGSAPAMIEVVSSARSTVYRRVGDLTSVTGTGRRR